MTSTRTACDHRDGCEDVDFDYNDPVAFVKKFGGFFLYVQMEEAKERVRRLSYDAESMFTHSIDGHEHEVPPHYQMEELSVGDVLGVGKYCTVEDVIMKPRVGTRKNSRESDADESRDDESVQDFVASSVIGVAGSQPRTPRWRGKRLKATKLHSMRSCGTVETERTDEDDYDEDFVSLNGAELGASQSSPSPTYSIPEEVTTAPMARKDVPQAPFMTSSSMGGFHKPQEAFVLKRIRPGLLDRAKTYAMADLVREARFLSILSHPSIVNFYGTGGEAECHPTYFILLERLVDTVDSRLSPEDGLWVRQGKESDSKWNWLGGKRDGQDILLEQLLIHRLMALVDVANALHYLHTNRLLFRDLKAESIGFDALGSAKIFDFGSVRELLPSDRVSRGGVDEVDEVDDVFRATGMIGTLQYMAPETIRCRPYGWKAESYAFGILLWEVATLQRYESGTDPSKFAKMVVRKDKRPSPLPPLVSKSDGRPKNSACLPSAVRGVLKQCLEADPTKRPCMAIIRNVLDASLQSQSLLLEESKKEQKRTLSIEEQQELLAALCSTLGDE